MLGVNINYYDKNILFFLIIWLFNIKKGVFYGDCDRKKCKCLKIK